MKKVLFIGNSHLISIYEAFKDICINEIEENELHRIIGNIDYRKFSLTDKNGKAEYVFLIFNVNKFRPLFHNDLKRNCLVLNQNLDQLFKICICSEGAELIFSFIGGNEHSMFSILENSVPFNFFKEGFFDTLEDALENGTPRQIIPESLVARKLHALSQETFLLLSIISQLVDKSSKIFHVYPPPPIPSVEHIKNNPEIFGELVNKIGITPALIRLKTYRVFCEVLGNFLSNLDIQPLAPPSECFDSQGGLLEKFWLGCTHGNKLYGKLVVDQIERLI